VKGSRIDLGGRTLGLVFGKALAQTSPPDDQLSVRRVAVEVGVNERSRTEARSRGLAIEPGCAGP